MNGKQKRKELLDGFSKYGLNECCCGGTNGNICCGGDSYFLSKLGKVGVLLPDEQEIKTIWEGTLRRIDRCGNYFIIQLLGIEEYVVFFHGEKVYEGKCVNFNSTSPSQCSYDYFFINNGIEKIFFYRGIEILKGDIVQISGIINYCSVSFNGYSRCFWCGKEFSCNEKYQIGKSYLLLKQDNVYVLYFNENIIKTFTNQDVSMLNEGAEYVLLSVGPSKILFYKENEIETIDIDYLQRDAAGTKYFLLYSDTAQSYSLYYDGNVIANYDFNNHGYIYLYYAENMVIYILLLRRMWRFTIMEL